MLGMLQGGLYKETYEKGLKEYLRVKEDLECMNAQSHWEPIPEAPVQIPLSTQQGTFFLFFTLVSISCLSLVYTYLSVVMARSRSV